MPASIDREHLLYKAGQGNWSAFKSANIALDQVYESAARWKSILSGIQKPWLCWNVDSDWCLAQQKLVRHVGWTPVIGYDPRVGVPEKTVPDAVVVNFNEHLKLPVLYPHFVMEFAFLFAPRLAFWHSDLLVREPLLRTIVVDFEALRNGEAMATQSSPGLLRSFTKKYRRYWELIGCTTEAASRNQFENGTGWWMDFPSHPNCPDEDEFNRRKRYHWDHGAGIYYWHRHCGGQVKVIRTPHIHEGHCTKIGNPDYVRSVSVNTCDARRHMSSELTRYFDLAEVCRRMELSQITTAG